MAKFKETIKTNVEMSYAQVLKTRQNYVANNCDKSGSMRSGAHLLALR